jgi:hypothetical protein
MFFRIKGDPQIPKTQYAKLFLVYLTTPSNYIVPNYWMLVNNKLGRIWKEPVMAYLKVDIT